MDVQANSMSKDLAIPDCSVLTLHGRLEDADTQIMGLISHWCSIIVCVVFLYIVSSLLLFTFFFLFFWGGNVQEPIYFYNHHQILRGKVEEAIISLEAWKSAGMDNKVPVKRRKMQKSPHLRSWLYSVKKDLVNWTNDLNHGSLFSPPKRHGSLQIKKKSFWLSR